MTEGATYDVKATWLLMGLLDDEEHVIRVQASSQQEARDKAQPEIDELTKTYGKGPSLVGIERRRG